LILEVDSSDFPRIASVEYDSRRVSPEALFVAVRGLATDGNRFIGQAIERGAAAVASENPAPAPRPAFWVRVRDARSFLSYSSSAFYGFPSRRMRLAGVTGTNGKTTTVYLVHSIVSQQGPALMIGTLGSVVGNETAYYQMTTPESPEIQKTLARGLRAGCETGVLEVSSHSLFFKRVLDCHMKVAVFTNLSQDHLDFHDSLESYLDTKSLLFRRSYNPGLESSLINLDDPWGRRLLEKADGDTCTFGFSKSADIYPVYFRSSTRGIKMELRFFDRRLSLESPLVGRHNGYNIMAAAGAAALLGIDDTAIQEGISALDRVPGRFEVVPIEASFTVVKDFAHTPDALDNALDLARQLTENRVICVFGCGGDRDRAKRPQMGRISVEKADHVIVTSDNPRSEDPSAIIREIVAGIPRECTNFEIVTDRRQAIRKALLAARPGDLVILAGKGHENYQEIDGKKHRFDECEIVKEEACCILK